MADYKVSRRVGHAHTLPSAPAFSFGGRHDKTPNDPGPGPGQYGHGLSLSQKGTGFGSSSRYKAASNPTPSAQDYQPSANPVRRSQPAYTFGTKSPPDHLKSKTPGPGSYDHDRAVNAVKPSPSAYTIAERTASDKEAGRRPGPDAYNPDYRHKEVHAASIKFKNDPPPTADAGPGPGEYAVDVVRSKSAGKTFGGARQQQFLDNGVPGPGYYAPPDDAVRARRASWSIGKSNRDTLRKIYGPGPGQYVQEPVIPHDAGHSAASDHKSPPAYTFGGKPFLTRPPANPGPGDYGVPRDPGARCKPAYTIKGVSSKEQRAKLPGPGAYQAERADKLVRASAPAVSISWRHEEAGAKDAKPGPGTYDVRSDDTRLGVSLKFRNDLTPDFSSNPAPHDYADKDFKCFGACCQSCGGTKGFTMGKRLQSSGWRESGPGPQYAVGASTLGVAAAPTVYKSKVNMTLVM